MAVKHNLKIDQGTLWRKLFVWRDANGNRVNLTGWTGKMQIRDRVRGVVLIELTTANDGVRLQEDADNDNVTLGVIVLQITAAQSLELTTLKGVYDLVLTPPSGGPVRFIQGSVTFNAAVTVDE